MILYVIQSRTRVMRTFTIQSPGRASRKRPPESSQPKPAESSQSKPGDPSQPLNDQLYNVAEKIIIVGRVAKELAKKAKNGGNWPLVRIHCISPFISLSYPPFNQLQTEADKNYRDGVFKSVTDFFEGWANFQEAHRSLAEVEIRRIKNQPDAQVCDTF